MITRFPVSQVAGLVVEATLFFADELNTNQIFFFMNLACFSTSGLNIYVEHMLYFRRPLDSLKGLMW